MRIAESNEKKIEREETEPADERKERDEPRALCGEEWVQRTTNVVHEQLRSVAKRLRVQKYTIRIIKKS